MRTLRLLIIFAFLAAVVGGVVLFNTSKPRLLILHSYDSSYSWTRDVDVGIRRVLGGRNDYAVRWYYMDTKRHPWKDYKVNEGKAVIKLIERWQPSVVIAVDDDAQEYAMKHFANHPEVRIVFAGVSDSLEHYGYDKAANVTGILERKPFSALKESLLLLGAQRAQATQARPLRIMFLGDASESVRNDERLFAATDWAPIQVLPSRLAQTFGEWQDGVRFANENEVDFVVTANYRKLLRSRDGKELVKPEEVLGWTEEHARPLVVGTNGFFAEDGGIIAIGTSPYEQGEVALEMARQILLEGRAPRDIPVESTKQFVVAMRASSLARRNVTLPSVYEAAARASANYYP